MMYRFAAILLLLSVYSMDVLETKTTPANVHIKKAGKKHSKTGPMLLVDTPQCVVEITLRCPKRIQKNNFLVLSCLERDEETVHEVSSACQQLIWEFKRNLTTSHGFEVQSQRVCEEDIDRLTECRHERLPKDQAGHLVACLLDNKYLIRKADCRDFLTDIGSVVFSDYRLVYRFVNSCQSDIKSFHCGRLHPQPKTKNSQDEAGLERPINSAHSQGRTIDCLAEKVEELSPQCKFQILRIGELQSDDYHMNRALFYACRDEREKLCSHLHAGQGRVLACLMDKKDQSHMSDHCATELTRRELLTLYDYRIDYNFAHRCEDSIKHANCSTSTKTVPLSGDQGSTRLSSVLLCLEGAVKSKRGHLPDKKCSSAMLNMRRRLMSDYTLNPEIVAHCKDPIKKECGRELRRKGRTLHCLFQLAPKKKLPVKCLMAVNTLLLIADAGEETQVDPVVWSACHQAVSSLCSHLGPDSGGDIYRCLMGALDAPDMTSLCAKRLTEIQYFLTRDFALNPRLFRACRKDAHDSCNTPLTFPSQLQRLRRKKKGNFASAQVFNCLYQHTLRGSDMHQRVPLSAVCKQAVQDALKERSAKVQLEPLLYEPCMEDLIRLCANETEPGREFSCLQTNMDALKPECEKAVGQFTRLEEEDPYMSPALKKACRKMVGQFCDSLPRPVQPGQVMECLLEAKYEDNMNPQCRSALELHQKTSLKKFQISYLFTEACGEDVARLCRPRDKWQSYDKATALSCLTEYFLSTSSKKTMKKGRLSRKCRKQLKAELLQRGESVALDPLLQKDCGEDVARFCADVKPGKAKVIACLEEHQTSLTQSCHRRLFRRELLQAEDSELDAELIRICRPMIYSHCLGYSKSSKLVDCLAERMDRDSGFAPRCRQLVLTRMEVRRRYDQLDRTMVKRCRTDITRFCGNLVDKSGEIPKRSYQGEITRCLRKQLRRSVSTKEDLSEQCAGHIRGIVIASNFHYQLDPLLRVACKDDVVQVCNEALQEEVGSKKRGHVTECLRRALEERRIKKRECQAAVRGLVLESSVQEPKSGAVLDSVLAQACVVELATVCAGSQRPLSCLVWMRNERDLRKRVSHRCQKVLSERIRLWSQLGVMPGAWRGGGWLPGLLVAFIVVICVAAGVAGLLLWQRRWRAAQGYRLVDTKVS